MAKKTMRKFERALPWAISAISTAGMLASALMSRAKRRKVRTEVAEPIREPEPDAWENAESGAV